MRQAMFRASDDMKEYIEGEQNTAYFEVGPDDDSRVSIDTQLQHADSVF